MSFWTEERVNFLRVSWERGVRASVIAKDLGTTRNAVLGKLFRSGLLGFVSEEERGRRVSQGNKEFYTTSAGKKLRRRWSEEARSRAAERMRRRWAEQRAQ